MKCCLILAALMGAASPSLAGSAALASLELNTLAPEGEACRMTFTATAPAEIEKLVVETVLFDRDGAVLLLTLFDFGALPEAGLRVRQFDLPGLDCAHVGRVLFNGVDTCTGTACDGGALGVRSRVDGIEVLG